MGHFTALQGIWQEFGQDNNRINIGKTGKMAVLELQLACMNDMPLLVLASNSPRRRELLALGGWMFSVEVADVDETRFLDEAPGDYVRRLAEAKVRAIMPRAHEGHIIIGADTAVIIDGDVLGKPASAKEAHEMLTRLRGCTHQVYTGIAVLGVRDGNLLTDVIVTDVPMRNYSDDEIATYIASGDPLDKAGAYGIQNPGFQPVAHMEGCYASVMGLPLCSLTFLLHQVGISPRADVAGSCQSALSYQCPVSRNYLRGEH
jgi:MAF protein